MEFTFQLKGLSCPGCAARISHDVQKLKWVAESDLNLIRQTIRIRANSEMRRDDAHAQVESIVHAYEPDVEVLPDTAEEGALTAPHDEGRRRVIEIVTGALLWLPAAVVAHVRPELSPWMLALFIPAYLILGYRVIARAFKNILKGNVFDENLLMLIATAGAFGIGEYPEAVAVMLLYQVGGYFENRAVDKSRRSIQSLLDIRPDKATVIRDGSPAEVMAESVAPGENILVRPGERVPLDGIATEGTSSLDTRALTGESVPRSIRPGDTALSGCINLDAALVIRVTKKFDESTSSKIIDLVENASSQKAPAENFITKFARHYTPAVIALAVILALVPLFVTGAAWSDWLTRAFVFLVISCPCALVLSVPLAYFSGLGAASRKGILIKGGNWLEALHLVDTFVFDKTGTLTRGTFEITHADPADGISEAELLDAAAHAEKLSAHPIARAIPNKENAKIPDEHTEIPGLGTSARYGADTYLSGNDKLMKRNGIAFVPSARVGTAVYIARNNAFLGSLTIADEIREGASQTLKTLKEHGIQKLAMLTGDSKDVAEDIASKLGIDQVEAELLPAQKLEKLTQMLDSARKSSVAYVGDGINDAPSLARADVGIAMGALGSDAAVEAADVVLMSDNIALLSDAVSIARRTRRIVVQNIAFALGVKGICLLLGALGQIGLPVAIFADVGVMILCVLNAMRMLKK